jgi:Zn-dependent protease with chaperone function
MSFIKPFAVLLIIPLFGFIVSEWVLYDLNEMFQEEGSSLFQFCTSDVFYESQDLQSLCKEVLPILWMKIASILSAIVGIILLFSFIVLSKVTGQNRQRIAKVFPPLVFITLLTLSILVLVQGVILTYGAYIAESYAVGRVHFIAIGMIGLVALITAIGLIFSSFKLIKKPTHSVLADELNRSQHPKLFSLIDEVAESLGAKPPKNVITGLEPNFYVTNAEVTIIGKNTKTLHDGTLFVSLPLARILTVEEFKGIIGHELGHFRGNDTHYSLKFAPVYSGLSDGIDLLTDDEGGFSIVTYPAATVLSYMMEVFHKNISAISRVREFEADNAACEVSNPSALATSLLKIGLYASHWGELQVKAIERLQKGKVTKNLSTIFFSIVDYDTSKTSISSTVKEISEQTITHPNDSHPTTSSRITNLGLNIDDINHELLGKPNHSCIDLFQDPISHEESLSSIQMTYFVALGVKLPESDESNIASTAIAAFGAHMVIADGKVEPEEINEAESLGISLSEEFDYIEFREFCHYPENIPVVDDLLDLTLEMSTEAKEIIYDYMKKIASSDGEVSSEEQILLNKIKKAFNF